MLAASRPDPLPVPPLSAGAVSAPAADAIMRTVFLRALGGVHLIALISLSGQIHGLIGSEGILPLAEFLKRAQQHLGTTAWWHLPTLCWLSPSDATLTALCAAGLGLSCLLILGIAPRWTLIGLWVTYLSITVAGQVFLSFQWDTLLLETTFCSIFYAPPVLWGRSRTWSAAYPWARWLLWALAFKLMLLSGATKLLSGDPTWWQGTALNYHYFTQPIPSWVSWYAHHAPPAWHRLSLGVMFVIELALPWLVFAGRWGRAIFALGTMLLMAAIEITGNYGFFNLLTAVLCLPLLDDAVVCRLNPWTGSHCRATTRMVPPSSPATVPAEALSTRPGILPRWVSAGLCGLIMSISFLTLVRELVRTQRPDKLPPVVTHSLNFADRWLLSWSEPWVLEPLAAFRTINGYGLFRVMTTQRPELIIEYSHDGQTWQEYDFPYKPGRIDRPPPIVAPHMPRLDWQMWFAALHPRGHAYWLDALLQRILQGNAQTASLMGEPDIARHPPRMVRLVYYQYEFSDPEQKQRRGEWWFRMRHGELTPPLSLP